MRAKVSRKLLDRFEKNTSEFFRRRQLQVLMNLAAKSFDVSGEKLGRGPALASLRQYADFTCRCMETYRAKAESGAADREKDVAAIEETLFRDAYRLGHKIRRVTGLKTDEDLSRLIRLLYRNIGIKMRIKGNLGTEHTGEVTVSNCYFGRFYSPDQCRLMSCVDSGIVSGICGGGKLHFSQRITEGCESCRAYLADEEIFQERGENNG